MPHLDSSALPHVVMAFSVENETLDTIMYPDSEPPEAGQKSITGDHKRVHAKTPAFAFSTALVHAGAAKTLPASAKRKLPWVDTSRFFFFVFNGRRMDMVPACAAEQNLPPLKKLGTGREDSNALIKL